ncbi:hypothetical protein Tco_0891653 [Tanacetum coccineum]|uniref:Uncharacterized protein n=1 Tax=Tanacetum coccineum TaxID=301880 RepID=A0ABQ5C3X1_9ASTR
MANNETECSPSEVYVSDSDSELLILTPWSDESKNKKKTKRWREEFEWKRSLFEIDHTFGINAFDLDKGTEVMKDKMPSEAVEQEMDDHVPDEIDSAKCEQVPNHVVNKEIKWYKDHLYEMHLLLNPPQREELENELRSREELAVLQVKFADMKGQMQPIREELKKS